MEVLPQKLRIQEVNYGNRDHFVLPIGKLPTSLEAEKTTDEFVERECQIGHRSNMLRLDLLTRAKFVGEKWISGSPPAFERRMIQHVRCAIDSEGRRCCCVGMPSIAGDVPRIFLLTNGITEAQKSIASQLRLISEVTHSVGRMSCRNA
jgi:hypothetical protein